MGRPDKRDRQKQRARSAVDNALARKRFGEAADALLDLPVDERSWALESLSLALAGELGSMTPARDAASALKWLARVEREPRLLPQGTNGERVRWSFFIAALRSRQWPRARRLFDELGPVLAESPLLARLDALVRAEGNPDPELFLQAPDLDRARLGYDDARPKAGSHTPPSTLAEVEQACLECLSLEPWHRFREVILGWLRRTPAPVAGQICRTAVLLSQRELVERSVRDNHAALEVARFCATLTADAGAPPELEPAVARSVAILSRVMVGTIKERALVDSCAAVASAALRYPALADLMETVTLGPLYDLTVLDGAERLFSSMLEQRRSSALLLRAAGVLALRAEHAGKVVRVSAPAWLLSALECVLLEPKQLADEISELMELRKHEAVGDLLDMLPIPMTVRTIDALWPHVRDPLREVLAAATAELAVRMRASATPKTNDRGELARIRAMLNAMDPELSFALPDKQLAQLLRSPEGQILREQLEAGEGLATPLPPAMHELWSTLEERVAPYQVSLLEIALQLAESSSQRAARVASFWARRPTLLSRLEAIREASERGLHRTLAALEDGIMSHIVPQPVDAARALSYASNAGAPPRLCRTLAQALISAVERDESQRSVPEVADALHTATRLVKKRVKTAGGGKSRKKAPPKAAKNPTKKRVTKDSAEPVVQKQIELFGRAEE